jgi:branched-subunit amino acid aminotransferase/4-amino-4-deoxychorismate lyase
MGEIANHLARLRRTAEVFDVPFDETRICNEIERALERYPASRATQEESLAQDKVLIRLRLANDGTPQVFLEPLIPLEEPVRVCISNVVVQTDDPMLRWKTSWRPAYERAAEQARDANCFEALLLNERGEITEGTRTNVFVRIDGQLYTPPLACGLLPGILRERLVAEKTAIEKILQPEDLRSAQELYVGNSARGLLQAQLVESRIPAL